MIPFRKTIGFRLLGVAFILLALPLLVDSFILIQELYVQTIAKSKAYLVEIGQLRELPLTQLQPLNKPLIDVFIQDLNLEEDFPQTPNDQMNKKLEALAKVGGFSNIFLIKYTDDDEYIVTASGLAGSVGENLTDFFKLNNLYAPEALERGFTSYITYDNKTLQPFFLVAHVIYSEKEQRVLGVLAVSQNISKELSQLLKLDTQKYHVSFAFLLPSSIVFAATDPELRFKYFFPLSDQLRALFLKEQPIASEFLPQKPIAIDERIGLPFFEFEWMGEKQIGYINKLPEINYSLLTYASHDAIFARPFFQFFNVYIVYGILLVLGGLIAYFLTKRMAKPIRSLSVVMQKIQEGDLNYRYQKDALGFEINALGSMFNEMVDAVIDKKQSAEKQRVDRETLGRELKLGQQVQRNLLPHSMPQYPGVEIAEKYIPAIEVGGDFYDVFVKNPEKDRKIVIAVADASGKGVQACFYSLSMRNILRTCAKEYPEIGQAMSAANNLFLKDTGESGMFVTVLAGEYDARTRVFSYHSCGHNPGLIRRANGQIDMLGEVGIAMGVLPFESKATYHVQLHLGDVVVLYSDGITEAHDMDYQLYGEERLMHCLSQAVEQAATDIVDKIVEDVETFVGLAPQHDDITLLVMKIRA